MGRLGHGGVDRRAVWRWNGDIMAWTTVDTVHRIKNGRLHHGQAPTRDQRVGRIPRNRRQRMLIPLQHRVYLPGWSHPLNAELKGRGIADIIDCPGSQRVNTHGQHDIRETERASDRREGCETRPDQADLHTGFRLTYQHDAGGIGHVIKVRAAR